VCTKYQEAAKIVNLALQGLVQQCVPGAKVIDLCEFGHSILNASAAKLYTKKSNGAVMDRGVAFPVCISVNDVVCNDSPLLSEERVRDRSYICGRGWIMVAAGFVQYGEVFHSRVSTKPV
jgi:methionine aminopeptidase